MLDVLDPSATQFVQEAERNRIARELHDGVVQTLTALVADLECFRASSLPVTGEANPLVVAKVESWQSLARESLASMRQALGRLRGLTGIETGLEPAISTLLTELQDEGYYVEYESSNWPHLLPFEYTLNLYYIIREVLTNIRKHANAFSIKIHLSCFEGHLNLSIQDDGTGMAKPPRVASIQAGNHHGLIGLRERAAILGGQVFIESIAGKGTRLAVSIPLPEDV